MQHTVLQLDTHLWVRGHQLTIVTPVQGGDLVHQGSSAVEGQSIAFEDHLALGRQQRQSVQLQRTIWAPWWEKSQMWLLYITLNFFCCSLITRPQLCFHRSYYESAVLEKIGCRQQQFINATHRISCHSSLIHLEIFPCWAAGKDIFLSFFSTNSSNYWGDLEQCYEFTLTVIQKLMFSETKHSLNLARLSPQLSWLSLSPRRGFPLRFLG